MVLTAKWVYPSADVIALCDRLADARPVITESWARYYAECRDNAHVMRDLGLSYSE